MDGNLPILGEPATVNLLPLILTLDTHGVPHRWITWQHACYYYSKNQVAWSLGERAFTVHGGLNRITGERSTISGASINSGADGSVARSPPKAVVGEKR